VIYFSGIPLATFFRSIKLANTRHLPKGRLSTNRVIILFSERQLIH